MLPIGLQLYSVRDEMEKDFKGKFKLFAIDNKFVPHMKREEALRDLLLDSFSITETVLEEEKGEI